MVREGFLEVTLELQEVPMERSGTETSRKGNREPCRERDVAGRGDVLEGGQCAC